jgi:putative ABC transport system permease protein
MGAVVGVAGGYIAVTVMTGVYPNLDFTPPIWSVAGAVLVAVASGVFFGILPARRAADLDPIAALSGQ